MNHKRGKYQLIEMNQGMREYQEIRNESRELKVPKAANESSDERVPGIWNEPRTLRVQSRRVNLAHGKYRLIGMNQKKVEYLV
jgi:hypothetical protein